MPRIAITNPDELVWKHLKADTVGRMAITELVSAPCAIRGVDDVVGDDAETHPAVHSDGALVSAAIEAVSPFDDADASLTSGAPFLAVAEPALSLLALAFSVPT
jgi:hypothetical protein